MFIHFIIRHRYTVFAIFLWLVPAYQLLAQLDDVALALHVRGIYQCKITLLRYSEGRIFKTLIEHPEIKGSGTALMMIPAEVLPGEFSIRFDYKEKETDKPYPSEKFIFIHDQDLELWVNPMYSNNPDSAWFQEGERENSAYRHFSSENSKRKERLGVLQNFLLNYDEPGSAFYQQGIEEYGSRRIAYNRWLGECIEKDKALFVSNLYWFEYVPDISWEGAEPDRLRSAIEHYFDGMDFSSPLIIRIADMKKWMDNYVNLYGQFATTIALRDSLFAHAGRTAIEKARKGNPLVYGWMVDYFYRGFESNGIDAGIKILEPYLNDPNCLTSKRLEINRRLEGIKTIVPGAMAPEISLIDADGESFKLSSIETSGEYVLLLFWSAGCSHCMETVDELYPWQQQNEIKGKITVVAIGLDDNTEDAAKWKNRIKELASWIHLGEPQGINSKVAGDYFVLSTPVMILLDAKSKEILAIPGSVRELKKVIRL